MTLGNSKPCLTGGVLAGNGKIYGIPGVLPIRLNFVPINECTEATTKLLVIDPTTNTVESLYVGWHGVGGVLADNGKIYSIPLFVSPNRGMLIIDPTTNAIDTTTIYAETSAVITGGVLADNGKIYGIPFDNGGAVLVVDPSTNATTIIRALEGSSPPGGQSVGGVLAGNGKIYGIPYSTGSLLIIDPATNAVDLVAYERHGYAGNSHWAGGVLGNNGKIYCIPWYANDVFVIDPMTNSTDTLPAPLGGKSKYFGGVLAADGKIYCMPYAHEIRSVLTIDPGTGTTHFMGIITYIDSSYGPIFCGAVQSNNGNIYGMSYTPSAVFGIAADNAALC